LTDEIRLGGRRAVVVWGTAVAVYFLAIFHRSSLGVAGLVAADRFHITASQLSTFTVLQLLVYAAMQIPVGVLLDRYGPQRLLVAGTVGLVLIGVLAVIYLGGGDSVVRGFGLSLGDTDISTGRFHFWRIATQIAAAHPVLGSGLDSFGVAFTKFDTQSGLYRVEQAHNDYLQAFSDGGLLGFACVAAFVVLMFKNGIKSVKASTDDLNKSIALGSLAGCFGIAIHSFFDFPLRTPSNALFFLLLVSLATIAPFAHRKT